MVSGCPSGPIYSMNRGCPEPQVIGLPSVAPMQTAALYGMSSGGHVRARWPSQERPGACAAPTRHSSSPAMLHRLCRVLCARSRCSPTSSTSIARAAPHPATLSPGFVVCLQHRLASGDSADRMLRPSPAPCCL